MGSTKPGPFDALDDLSLEELRQRLLSLQAIIERAPIPIAIAHDPACRYISANRALAELLKLSTESNISLTPPPGHSPPYPRTGTPAHDGVVTLPTH